MSDQLQMFEDHHYPKSTLSLSDRLAKTSAWLGKGQGWAEKEVVLSRTPSDLLPSADLTFLSGKMLKEHSAQTLARTFGQLSKPLPTLGGYRLEWQLLNTAWFLPQNRERIYLVGLLADKCAGQVFPIEESDWNPDKARQQQGKRLLVNCIDSGYGKGADGKRTVIKVGQWRDWKNSDGEIEGFREMKSGMAPSLKARARQDASDQPVVKIAQKGRGFNKGGDHDICPTISTSSFEQNNHVRMGAIRGRDPDNPKSRVAGLPTEQMIEINKNDQQSNCLSTIQKDNCVVEPERIRRLTEVECERLQGFPDSWTQYGDYGGEIKEVSATQRYKCLGNAVTVDVVRAVGERVLKCLAD